MLIAWVICEAAKDSHFGPCHMGWVSRTVGDRRLATPPLGDEMDGEGEGEAWSTWSFRTNMRGCPTHLLQADRSEAKVLQTFCSARFLCNTRVLAASFMSGG